MQPNRREALKTGLGVITAALVPSWIIQKRAAAQINLDAFCDTNGWNWKYDCSRPFIQESVGTGTLYTYATDARICLRVPARDLPPQAVAVPLPPANILGWKHDSRRGWKPWPASRPVVMAESECPQCKGHGVVNEKPPCENVHCIGWSVDTFLPQPYFCENCRKAGDLGELCGHCSGTGGGRFPGAQKVGGVYVSLPFDRKIRQHLRDVEWCPADKPEQPIPFRFDGGWGLVMPIDPQAAARRLEV